MRNEEITSELLQDLLQSGKRPELNEFLEDAAALYHQDEHGKTLLHYAFDQIHCDRATANLLFEKITARALCIADEKGNTPLHIAAESLHQREMHFMVFPHLLKKAEELQFNWALKNKDGSTIVHLAFINSYVSPMPEPEPRKSASYLKMHAPSINLDVLSEDGTSSLTLMLCSQVHTHEAEGLLDCGASPLAFKDADNLTQEDDNDKPIPNNPLLIIKIQIASLDKKIEELNNQIEALKTKPQQRKTGFFSVFYGNSELEKQINYRDALKKIQDKYEVLQSRIIQSIFTDVEHFLFPRENSPSFSDVICGNFYNCLDLVTQDELQQYGKAQFYMALLIMFRSNYTPESYQTESKQNRLERLELALPHLINAARCDVDSSASHYRNDALFDYYDTPKPDRTNELADKLLERFINDHQSEYTVAPNM